MMVWLLFARGASNDALLSCQARLKKMTRFCPAFFFLCFNYAEKILKNYGQNMKIAAKMTFGNNPF